MQAEAVAGWTGEQLDAIERRQGELLLDAGAGSGKTSVLVERFARAVLQDEVDVGAILAITFTDKAAAELRDRIRTRLHGAGADEAARATEGAYISTIHGFCARVLRTHALAAGIDPKFAVLDEQEGQRLAVAAFEEALEAVAAAPGGVDLIASYGAGALRGAIFGVHAELRSRGAIEPRLPPLAEPPSLDPLRRSVQEAARDVIGELRAVADPGVRVVQALERLERVGEVLSSEVPWPGELDAVGLPAGNGAALSTEACLAFGQALARLRAACEHRWAVDAHALLDRLLREFGSRYAARKREMSGLDFEDLELECLELLSSRPDLRERYASRFASIMVDELQDTSAVQLELIELIARDNLFTVGDAQQSIYGFRHADLELFERRGERLEPEGARIRLRTNFRSRREILEVLNDAFASVLGERYMRLDVGRGEPPADAPLVELLVADKGADYAAEGLASPWRLAEARALAERIERLVGGGAAPGEIVVLTRASTDLRAYERALEERGVPTYVIGGRGYWSHPQVIDLVSYLRALANPRDEEALYTLLSCPLVGASLDALVILGSAGRETGRDPWWVVQSGPVPDLSGVDRERLSAFAEWFARERLAAARIGVSELIERVLERTGYDLTMLAMPGGERRLANVRKLMRLAREHEAVHGLDLRGFLELVQARASGFGGRGGVRESEAPVEGEALDAVRLMTIHRAKGLEFEIVCVADLGRGPRWGGGLLRLGKDGRFGLRLSEPGTGKALPALDYVTLGEEQRRLEESEERRIFYVAMTRARERLILSGAARLEAIDRESSPMGWILPAMGQAGVEASVVGGGDADADGAGAGASRGEGGGGAEVASGDVDDLMRQIGKLDRPGPVQAAAPPAAALAPAAPATPSVTQLSYSALSEFDRCGYRFYVERVLGLPPAVGGAGPSGGVGAAGSLSATERGNVLHALLERLDFRRPVVPSAQRIAGGLAGAPVSASEADEMAELLARFAASAICRRLGAATSTRREERFSFQSDRGPLITGVFDVLAREPAGQLLVVDYKSDRLDGAEPEAVADSAYARQRLVYALAALLAGADRVDVAHVFLERPDQPAVASYRAADADGLQQELSRLVDRVVLAEFAVAEQPHRSLCSGCPAEGGLCSWPLEMTRREEPDRLF